MENHIALDMEKKNAEVDEESDMNFKKLSSVLARRKMLVLYSDGVGEQWAGDDFSCYELSGLPSFSIDSLLFTFGVKPDKKESWFTDTKILPKSWDLSMDSRTDRPIVIDDNGILYKGTIFSILRVGSSCYVLPERYLQPIYSDQMQLFLRTMPETGEGKIIAKEGMFVTALFAPISASEDLQDWMVKTCNAMN